MKIINIFILCLLLGVGIVFPCSAQKQDSQDEALLHKIHDAYNRIPREITREEFIDQANRAQRIVTLLIDSLSGNEAKKKARLLNDNGLLWSLGCRAVETQDSALREEVARRVSGLDLDSPDLELLENVEATNLLNGYFQLFMPQLSGLERATHVLYNIKSEKIRNPYVMSVLVSELKRNGYTDEIKGLLEDIELCSKTEATRREAAALHDKYYPIRAGQEAPDFEMEDEHGKRVKLSDFRGKAVFIDVWATWCGGCVEGLPYFIALQDQYKDRKDVVFLTISDDGVDAKKRWLDFLKERKYSGKMPHLIINEEQDNFTEDYRVTGIPRYILIDPQGKIVNAWHVAANHELFPFFFQMELDNMSKE